MGRGIVRYTRSECEELGDVERLYGHYLQQLNRQVKRRYTVCLNMIKIKLFYYYYYFVLLILIP